VDGCLWECGNWRREYGLRGGDVKEKPSQMLDVKAMQKSKNSTFDVKRILVAVDAIESRQQQRRRIFAVEGAPCTCVVIALFFFW
jgi:hypothetical protein